MVLLHLVPAADSVLDTGPYDANLVIPLGDVRNFHFSTTEKSTHVRSERTSGSQRWGPRTHG